MRDVGARACPSMVSETPRLWAESDVVIVEASWGEDILWRGYRFCAALTRVTLQRTLCGTFTTMKNLLYLGRKRPKLHFTYLMELSASLYTFRLASLVRNLCQYGFYFPTKHGFSAFAITQRDALAHLALRRLLVRA